MKNKPQNKPTDKTKLRKEMLLKRDALSPKEILDKSVLIHAKLLQSEEFKAAKTVFTYLSMGSEVSTYEFVRQVWRHGKQAALPVAIPGDPVLRFKIIHNFDGLVQSRFGVMEPSKGEIAVPDSDTLLIVPGLVFDKNKNRIGYGGGYYDRYMKEHKTLANIGICYSFQIVDAIQPEQYDVPVDRIITEEGI